MTWTVVSMIKGDTNHSFKVLNPKLMHMTTLQMSVER